MKGSRIQKAFEGCKERGECAFIPFVSAGDPDMEATYEIVAAMADNGADCIELGIPFSDPLADGPTIQASSQRALRGGVNPEKILALVLRLRRVTDCPLVLMGYYNPVLKYGLRRFAQDVRAAGADGTIIPDLPLEEASSWMKEARKEGIANIFLVAPNTPLGRAQKIARASQGFLYYVSVTGITGARDELPKGLSEGLEAVRALSPVPVAVGFGVSSPAQVRILRSHADGIIVGSAIVRMIEKGSMARKKMVQEVAAFVREMKRATTRSSVS